MSSSFVFHARLQRLSPRGGSHVVVVPLDIAEALLNGERRGRVMVTLGPTTWHAGLNPFGGGRHYVQVGRNYFEPLGYSLGDVLQLSLKPDTTPYGMQPCEEFLAVAEQDAAGEALFQKELTTGTQRSILHRIAGARTSDGRIERALKIFDQLHLGERNRKVLLGSIRAAAMQLEPGLS